MVTPKLAEQIKRPEDLVKLTLLQDDQTTFIKPPVGWAAWFDVAGVDVDPTEIHGPHFNQADHAVSAALASAGALMGRVSLTEAALRDGRLVMPYDLSLTSGATYRIVCPEGAEKRPRVASFIDWVKTQVEEMKELSEGRRFVAAPER